MKFSFAPLVYAERSLMSFSGVKSCDFFQLETSLLRSGDWVVEPISIRNARYLRFLSVKYSQI